MSLSLLNLFLNLFSMMLSTGIPELMRLSDIYYLRDAFSADLDDASAARILALAHP